jgi:hypothetical protein
MREIKEGLFDKSGDDFKDTFLKLTEYTIPFKHETKLEKYLPVGYKKDSIGNYYIEVGASETLFTTHLDTYCEKYEKVKHVIDGDIIKTDGKTILGGDNKLGMTIMLFMIKKGIPGTYYFFLGEEPILSGGLWGSQNALSANPDFFKKFKRAVAFDRKQMGSVVTRQKARVCCSGKFAEVLSNELTKLGVESKPDPNAYYTDTATFLDTIPECTNISAGGWDEHYTTEWVDLTYTKKVLDAACKIDWENLPTERKVIDYTTKYRVEPRHRFVNKSVINGVKKILNRYGLMHTNKLEFDTYHSDTLVFNTWFHDLDIRITILEDILVQIEDYSDIRFDFKDINKLNIYFGNIFGIDIDPNEYKMLAYEDGGISILGEMFDDVDEYIEHFDSINSDDTSYVIKKGGVQYKEDKYILPKELVIKWFNDNVKE